MIPPQPEMEIFARVLTASAILCWYPAKAVTDWWYNRGMIKRYKKFIKDNTEQ